MNSKTCYDKHNYVPKPLSIFNNILCFMYNFIFYLFYIKPTH